MYTNSILESLEESRALATLIRQPAK